MRHDIISRASSNFGFTTSVGAFLAVSLSLGSLEDGWRPLEFEKCGCWWFKCSLDWWLSENRNHAASTRVLWYKDRKIASCMARLQSTKVDSADTWCWHNSNSCIKSTTLQGIILWGQMIVAWNDVTPWGFCFRWLNMNHEGCWYIPEA